MTRKIPHRSRTEAKLQRDLVSSRATSERYRRILHAEALDRVSLQKADIGERIDIGGHGFWVERDGNGGLIVVEDLPF